MRSSYLIILILLNFFWAATFSAYKVLEEFLTPGEIVTARFGLAAAMLLAVWHWLPGRSPRGWDLFKTGALGIVVFVLGHRLQVFGNQLSTAGNSSILMAIEPIIGAVAAAIFLRERIGPRRVIGFLFGMFGVALLNGVWRPDFRWVSLGASVIFISSFFCETAYSIVGKKIITRGTDLKNSPEKDAAGSTRDVPSVGPIKVLALALISGTMLNLLLDGRNAVAATATLPATGWILLMALALICTAFGYSFWLLAVREGEVNIVTLTVFAQPLFGVALAKFWVGESLHWGQFWGGIAIVSGLVIGLSRQIKNEPREGNIPQRAV